MIDTNLFCLSQVMEVESVFHFHLGTSSFPLGRGSWPSLECCDFMTVVFLTVRQIPRLSLRELPLAECGASPSWVADHYFTGRYFLVRARVPELTGSVCRAGPCLGPHLLNMEAAASISSIRQD